MMMNADSANPPDWLQAARRLLGDDVTVRSDVMRIVSSGDAAAHIREWDATVTSERVAALRALHRLLPDDAAWLPRPVGEADAVVLLAGRLYDACGEVPGLPLNRHGEFTVGDRGSVNLPLHDTADHGDMLVEAARALGRIHTATSNHAALSELGTATVAELVSGATARWQVERKRLGAKAANLPEVRRWLRCGNRVIPVARERIAEATDIAQDRGVLLHANVWPAYLLVDEPSRPQALLGVTGWRHAASGSPVIDLAQLCVRVTGWSEATTESVLGAYSDHAALPPAARRLVPVVAAVDLLDQLGRLLVIAWLDDALASDPAQPFVRGGIKVLLRSLERLTNVLAPDEPVQRRFHPGPRTAARRTRPERSDATGRGSQRSSESRQPGSGRSPRPSRRGRRRAG